MPQTLQSSARSTSTNSVLLLEEYDALAAAIRSALKKFAPHHRVNAAASLAETERFIESDPPALIVIDFDPAYPGLIEFLYRARDICPDARVLVMGVGVSKEIAAGFRAFGAFQFIEKPFDVLDFGAAVQALLGPWKDADAARERGTLRSMSLADVVALQCAGNRSAVLQAKSHGKSGEIHLVNGEVVHAVAGENEDAEALTEIFNWPDSRIEEIEKRPTRRTIAEPWTGVFLDAVRTSVRRPSPPSSPAEPTLAKTRTKTGKKLVVIDDTEMLLLFVEDTLAIADPGLQVTTDRKSTRLNSSHRH